MMRRPARLSPTRDADVRHAIVGRLLDLPAGARLLDVGGVPGRLARALPAVEVVTANVMEPADVVFDGERLPFEDGSFDAAASIDVLEHLPPPPRRSHLDEVLHVASGRVVLCCPLGTPEHIAAERELADCYAELAGRRESFLDEHLENGLPTEDELRGLAAGRPGVEAELLFNGDFAVNAELFRLGALAHFRHRPADRARFLWRRLATAPDSALRAGSRPSDNRAFMRLVEGS
jgi:SAM-dependent methyltransferase